MLRNFFLMAVAMLRRKKFLTFVNVFATTLTLTVLIVVAAVGSGMLYPRGAESVSDHFLVVDNVCFTGGTGGNENTWNSGPGYVFFRDYIQPLETPDKVSFVSGRSPAVSYVDGRKIETRVRRTDGAYWEILDFEFLEGRPILHEDVESGGFVAVVSRSARDELLAGQPATGREVTANGLTFTVVGVVENEPETNDISAADLWIPWSASPSTGYRDEWLGSGVAVLWVEDPSRRPAVQREFRDRLASFEYEDPERYDSAFAVAETKLDNLANQAADSYCSSDTFTGRFAGLVVALTLAFMLLPAINMVNLNVSRILERTPEIGLRKAAGATRRALVAQFVIENLVLTAVGGGIAFLLAPWVLSIMNRTMIQHGRLSLDWRVFVAGLVFITLFAVLSGAYPAWRMARLEPVEALRGGTRHV